MITNEELMAVRDDAVAALDAQKIGAEFVGAFGEAEKLQYVRGTIQYGVFCAIFVGAIKRVSVSTETGLITAIEFH